MSTSDQAFLPSEQDIVLTPAAYWQRVLKRKCQDFRLHVIKWIEVITCLLSSIAK